MADNGDKKTSVWVKVAATVIGGGLLFFIQFTVTSFSEMRERTSKIREDHALMMEQVEQLRRDEAKWGALREHDAELRRLTLEFEVLRQVWEYHTGKTVPRMFPTKSGQPKIDWARMKTLDQYRTEQFKRYPNESKKR